MRSFMLCTGGTNGKSRFFSKTRFECRLSRPQPISQWRQRSFFARFRAWRSSSRSPATRARAFGTTRRGSLHFTWAPLAFAKGRSKGRRTPKVNLSTVHSKAFVRRRYTEVAVGLAPAYNQNSEHVQDRKIKR